LVKIQTIYSSFAGVYLKKIDQKVPFRVLKPCGNLEVYEISNKLYETPKI
jgi:hypothetical protein